MGWKTTCIVMILLFLLVTVVTANEAGSTSCGEVSKNLKLRGNAFFTAGDTCFTITADNIVFDGNNAAVHARNGAHLGVAVANAKNVTVKNLKLINFAQGINVQNASNIVLKNNIIKFSKKEGIKADNVYGIQIANNSITVPDAAKGIVISPETVKNAKVYHNTITFEPKAVPAGAIPGVALDDPTLSPNILCKSTALLMPITTCKNLTQSAILMNDIFFTGTCLNITGKNIIIEGNGAKIIGNNSGSGYGVQIKGGNNVTIRNLDIINFTQGLHIVNASDITIACNKIFTNAKGGAENVYSNLTKNTTYVWNGNAINLQEKVSGVRIVHNIITTGGIGAYGVFTGALDGTNITVYNNTFFMSGNSSVGIKVAAANSTISSNTIVAAGSSSKGISGRGHITGNSITLTNLGGEGMRIDAESTVAKNIISTSGLGSHAIVLWFSKNSNFSGNKITANGPGSYCVDFIGSSDNVFTSDYMSALGKKVFFKAGQSAKNSFVNVSVSEGQVGFDAIDPVVNGEMTTNWYVNVAVHDAAGPIENAAVSISDALGNVVFAGATGASGSIPQQTLAEFTKTFNTVTYHTPHTIAVTHPNYTAKATGINLTETKNTDMIILLA